MNIRSSLALGLAAALVALTPSAFAQDLPSGYGTFAPSGSVFTTEISPATDTDDYAFQGYPGMSLTATVKPAKGSALVPQVQFIRPGGAVAGDDDGFVATPKGTSVVGTMILDAPGWWQVRVRSRNVAAPDPEPPLPPNPAVYTSGAYSVQIVYKLPPASVSVPSVAKSFSKKGVIESKSDVDDFFFQGHPQQTLAVTLSIPKGGTLFPALSLFRPDGTPVASNPPLVPFNGKVATVKGFVLDQTGTWRIRVNGLEHPDDGLPTKNSNTTGLYSISVKLGKPKAAPTLVPDDAGQYRFLIPAVGGATVTYAMKVAPGKQAPTFNSFRDPNGQSINIPSRISGTIVIPNYPTAPRPAGNYVLTFDSNVTFPLPVDFNSGVTFSWKMVPPKPAKGLKATISKDEPIIALNFITPRTGAAGTTITVQTSGGHILDPNDPDQDKVVLSIDRLPVEQQSVNDRVVSGKVPTGLSVGLHDVVVRSSTGQLAVAPGAFEIIPPPKLTSIEPNVGSFAGGYDITIYGSGFSKLTDPQIVINALNNIVPVNIKRALLTDTSITFVGPAYGTAGTVQFGVVDAANGVGALLLPGTFEFISSPAISRLVPNLTSVMGGDLIIVTGANFNPTDHLYIETSPKSNAYVEIPNTFVSSTRHQFTAPVRTKGPVKVYVVDQFNQPQPPRTRELTYFQYTNLNTSVQGVLPSGADLWDGVTTTTADYDLDGYEDLFISRVGTGSIAASPQTRVLQNQRNGTFLDVTGAVMPTVITSDDWRADRIWVTDLDRTLDGFPDIAIVTNSSVIPDTRSHVRLLVNEAAGGSGPNPNARVFRDRTTDLFPAPREMTPLYGGTAGIIDSWRGLDMWVGDIDKTSGQPEILITHKETKQELDVSCSPYCSSPFSSGYTYGFYWGGSREFLWDKSKAGGLGRYRFNRDFFPRKGGLRVPVVAPGGAQIPICNQQYGQPCVNRFTPFLGKRIAVADIDVDGNGFNLAGLPDVAVVSDDIVQRIYPPSSTLQQISSLQVGIQRFNPSDGALLTDVTDEMTLVGGDNRADALAIGQPGYPDGLAYGFLTISKAVPAGGLALRIIKYKKNTQLNHYASFEDVTSLMMPPLPPVDRWQASKIIYRDIDADGDQDLILVANAAPGGTEPALRILRNDVINAQVGLMREGYKNLIIGDASKGIPSMITSTEHLEGDTATIGDVNKDGTADIILTRANTTGAPPQTRIVITDNN